MANGVGTPTRITHLYLDTQQWNYLVDRQNMTPDELSALQGTLLAEVKAGRLAVVSSLPLFEEIAGTAHRNAPKYDLMRSLLFEATEHRWLLPLNERYQREARAGGKLPESARYLNRKIRREYERASRNKATVAKVSDNTYRQTLQFKNDQEAIRQSLRTRPDLLGPDGEWDPGKVDEWWSSVDVDDWTADAVSDGLPPGWAVGAGGFRADIPSAWLFTAFKLARIKRNLGEGRKISASDYIDAEHCGAGPYFDVLVTDDAEFRSTCELLPWRPFKIEGFTELRARLGSTAR